jgi:hypothetical protein
VSLSPHWGRVINGSRWVPARTSAVAPKAGVIESKSVVGDVQRRKSRRVKLRDLGRDLLGERGLGFPLQRGARSCAQAPPRTYNFNSEVAPQYW